MNESVNGGSASVVEIPYLTMGASFLIGMAVGYVVKKSFKLMLFLMGLSLILIFFLEYKHIVVVDQDQLLNFVDAIRESFSNFVLFLKDRVAQIKLSGTLSAVAGFIVGIKFG